MPKPTNLKIVIMQLFAGLLYRPIRELRFNDIKADTSHLDIPTRVKPAPCTIYNPPQKTGAPLPVYINFHGGGFVLGKPKSDDHICRYLAAKLSCVVINVDYVLAPQHPYPQAVHQAYDIVQWVSQHATARGWDNTRIAVGGHSAGANLATALCLLARDEGGVMPVFQLLDYPPLDLDTDPEKKMIGKPKSILSPDMAEMFNQAYIADETKRTVKYASPTFADDLSGLPPALVITAEDDMLREEADAYAQRLKEAGVPVTHKMFAGCDHGFTHFGPVPEAKEAITLMENALSTAFTKGT